MNIIVFFLLLFICIVGVIVGFFALISTFDYTKDETREIVSYQKQGKITMLVSFILSLLIIQFG